jgi:hypothetical protein
MLSLAILLMSATKSSGACTAFRSSGQFLQAMAAGSAGDGFSEFIMRMAGAGMAESGDDADLDGIGITPDEITELRIFDEFLTLHVQPNRIRDVQCKLLWNEWVRSFRRQTHGFPNLILEKEFNSVVLDRFSVGIADDGFRGAVYPGIRYIP